MIIIKNEKKDAEIKFTLGVDILNFKNDEKSLYLRNYYQA